MTFKGIEEFLEKMKHPTGPASFIDKNELKLLLQEVLRYRKSKKRSK